MKKFILQSSLLILCLISTSKPVLSEDDWFTVMQKVCPNEVKLELQCCDKSINDWNKAHPTQQVSGCLAPDDCPTEWKNLLSCLITKYCLPNKQNQASSTCKGICGARSWGAHLNLPTCQTLCRIDPTNPVCYTGLIKLRPNLQNRKPPAK